MIRAHAESISSSKAAPVLRGCGARLREAKFEDYPQIASLESRFELAAKPYDEWIHLWRGNPLYRQLGADWPIGWVLEDQDGKIVGSMGNIPLLYEFDGRTILAASGRHWVAEPAHRGASILLLDSLINQRNIDYYVNTTVSNASVPAVTALGCSRVPVGIWDEVAYWITNYLGCIKCAIAGHSSLSFPSRGGVSNHVKGMGNMLSKISRRALAGGWRKSVKKDCNVDVEVNEAKDFDDRFDNFWDELKRRRPHVLLAVRSRDYLQWHFKYALSGNRLWIATIGDKFQLKAYAIFCKTTNAKTGINQMKLVDYQALDEDRAMLASVVSWALRKCRSEGIHILEHTGRWLEEGEFFGNAAPFRRKLASWQHFYRVKNPALASSLRDKHSWVPSLFEGDATL